MPWATIAALVAVVLSLAGWIALLRARRAIRVARVALARAGEANEIADAANELSQEAAEISRRALAALTEQHLVAWEANWVRDAGALDLRQVGADDAFQVTVIVTGRDLHEVRRVPRLSPGERVTFDLPQIADVRRRHEAEQMAVQDSLSGSGMIYFAGRVEVTVQITVAWVSAAGSAKTVTLPDLRIR